MVSNLIGDRWAATRGVGRPTKIKETIKQHYWYPQIFQVLLVTCWLYRQYPYFYLFSGYLDPKPCFFRTSQWCCYNLPRLEYLWSPGLHIVWLINLPYWWFQHPISLVVSSPSEADIPWVVRIKNDQKHCYGSISPLSQCWLNPFQHYHALSPWMISSITS